MHNKQQAVTFLPTALRSQDAEATVIWVWTMLYFTAESWTSEWRTCPHARHLAVDIFAWVTWDVSTDLRCSLMLAMDFSARHTATHGRSTVNQHHLATALSLTWSRLRRFQTRAFGVWSCPADTRSGGADQKRAALSAYASFIISCGLTWIVLFYYCLQVVTWLSRCKEAGQ